MILKDKSTYALKRLDDFRWELPKSGAMRVPGIIYADDSILEADSQLEPLNQVANVATLPGILKASFAMPDMHWGYGFPIGGVAAFDWESGIISPGGVGFDINCGVRLASTMLVESDISSKLEDIVNEFYRAIPAGIGSTGSIKLSEREEKKMLVQGSEWAVNRGFGEASDLDFTEEGGCMSNADPDIISQRAIERGKKQLGTLGSGNHFVEIGVVEEIYDPLSAGVFGLFENQVVIMLHTGSRGFGYQVCDDYLAKMAKHAHKHGMILPDRQLSCAMIQSPEGQNYYNAMACAANYAWANRQILMSRCSDALMKSIGTGPASLGMNLVYDVCHNIAKKEEHMTGGEKRFVCVHRKGATRSFPPGHTALCDKYRSVGQPVIIPGDMGTASYVLTGTQRAMDETFGSTCHGAGRVLSRKAAKKAGRNRKIHQELKDKGIFVRWTGRSTMAEEMPEAYKDISRVVDIVHGAGISKKTARLRPVAVVKG